MPDYTNNPVAKSIRLIGTDVDDKASINHFHDDRYYTESEVDTVSGVLQSQIDDKPNNFLELDDTPTTYGGEQGKYIKVKEDETGLEYVTDLNLEIKNSFGSNFLSAKEFTISGSNIVKTEYFDSSGGSRKYFIDYNYNIDDNLTSYIITRDSDLTTQTFTCTYSGGELIKIAAS